jgi:hypothetical protein
VQSYAEKFVKDLVEGCCVHSQSAAGEQCGVGGSAATSSCRDCTSTKRGSTNDEDFNQQLPADVMSSSSPWQRANTNSDGAQFEVSRRETVGSADDTTNIDALKRDESRCSDQDADTASNCRFSTAAANSAAERVSDVVEDRGGAVNDASEGRDVACSAVWASVRQSQQTDLSSRGTDGSPVVEDSRTKSTGGDTCTDRPQITTTL